MKCNQRILIGGSFTENELKRLDSTIDAHDGDIVGHSPRARHRHTVKCRRPMSIIIEGADELNVAPLWKDIYNLIEISASKETWAAWESTTENASGVLLLHWKNGLHPDTTPLANITPGAKRSRKYLHLEKISDLITNHIRNFPLSLWEGRKHG